MRYIILLICFIAIATNVQCNVDIMIAFRQRNIEKLESIVYDISNHKSKNYGKYLSRNEILDIVSPPTHELRQVRNWLYQNNIKQNQITDYRDMWKISLDYYTLERLLNISVIPIKNSKMVVSHDVYFIPKHLQKIITFIGGIYKNNTLNIRRRVKAKNGVNIDPGYVGREVACKLYSINCSQQNSKVSVGAIEYQGDQGFLQSDLQLSQKNNGLNYTNKVTIVGPNYGIDDESELDIQMLGQTANNAELWFWDVSGWLYEFAVSFFNTQLVPDVISMSWGWAEDKQCSVSNCGNMTSEDYVDRVNNEYLKIVARGITILASSGDAGSPGRTSEGCDPTRKVNAVFPSSSPWVTSVGATFIIANTSIKTNWTTPLCQQNQCATGNKEHVTNFEYTGWTSGGGFSRYGTRIKPYWQTRYVQDYLNSGVPLPSNFSRHGRAYPDVTAFGHNCPVWMGGELSPVDGTSCSSPVFAAIVAILNQHQVLHGRPKLGYLNPILYEMAEDQSIFNHITRGNTSCTEEMCCPVREDGGSDYGFLATYGKYNPVYGLGSVNVKNMIAWLDKYMY